MTRIPVVNPSVVFQPVIDEAVLVDMRTGDLLVLNYTGILVWQRIDGRRTVDAVIQSLAAYVELPPDSVAADVLALLDTLAAQEFISYDAASPSEPAVT